jgi:hypothetical protein
MEGPAILFPSRDIALVVSFCKEFLDSEEGLILGLRNIQPYNLYAFMLSARRPLIFISTVFLKKPKVKGDKLHAPKKGGIPFDRRLTEIT